MDSVRKNQLESLDFPLLAFGAQQEYVVTERRLPHWSQAGTVCFITFRTWDSMPTHVVEGWLLGRRKWLQQHGIDDAYPNWRDCLQDLPRDKVREFAEFTSERWTEHLDALHGACVLRRPGLAKIVADSLRHFDGRRNFVVMPNHVHVLAAFSDEQNMLAQWESWKHYTAHEINRALVRRGRFWQQDGFDHLVRSADHFKHLRRYIADNPTRAGLRAGEYVHESRELGVSVSVRNAQEHHGGA